VSDRLKSIIALCALALFAPLAWPLVTGQVLWFDDLSTFHLPLRLLYRNALRAGDSLLWAPAILSGFYIHGEGQVGIFHPLHQLLYRTLPLGAAFNLELLINYVAAFAGMYWFMRRLTLGPTDALFGGFLFGFSGFIVLHHHHLNLVAAVVHVPWLLAAIDVVMEARNRRALAGGYAAVAVILASEILVGFPQALWFSLLAASVWVVFRTLETKRTARVFIVTGAIVTGGLLGAIQLLPTADVTNRSTRPLLPPEFALTYSLHPVNVLQLWSPYLFARRVYSETDYPFLHEFGMYSGAFLVVAPFWLWLRRHALGNRRRLVVGAITCAGVALVVALGQYGGIYPALVQLPGFRWGRASARYLFLAQFAMMVVATIAFADLRLLARDSDRIAPRRLWVLWIPAALSVLTTIALNGRLLHVFADDLVAPMGAAAAGSLWFVVVTALTTLGAGKARWAVGGLVLVTAADLGWSGIREVYRFPPRTIESLRAGMPRPSDVPDPGPLLIGDAGRPGNLLVLNGFRLSSGYVALTPAAYFEPSSPAGLFLSGTHWIWRPLAGLERVPDAADRARLVTDVRVLRSIGQNAGRMPLDINGLDLHQTAIIDHVVPPLAGPPGVARVIVDRPGDIVIETTLPGRQLLALTERYHPGWRATSEGRGLDTLGVNGDFLGCIAEAGTHRIEFRFMPRSFVQGAMLSALGVVVLVAGAGVIALREDAETAQKSQTQEP
jgi:hypothetical protein